MTGQADIVTEDLRIVERILISLENYLMNNDKISVVISFILSGFSVKSQLLYGHFRTVLIRLCIIIQPFNNKH